MAFCVPYLVERIACLFLNYSIPGDVSLYGNFVKERKHFGTSKKPTDQKKIPLEFDNPNNIFHKATVSSDKDVVTCFHFTLQLLWNSRD